MDEHTPTLTQALSSVGLNEAAAIFDVSVDTLRRRIKSNQMPEAIKSDGKYGATYTLAMSNHSAIAERENWVLNLDAIEAQSSPNANPQQSRYLEELTERVIAAETSAQGNAMQLNERTKERDQARSDLEHERAGHEQTTTELTETNKAKAVAEARVEELRNQVNQATQDRDSLGDKYSQLEKSSAESLSALSTDLDSVRSDLENAHEQTKATAGERDELVVKLAEAEASMGWWTRRKYQR